MTTERPGDPGERAAIPSLPRPFDADATEEPGEHALADDAVDEEDGEAPAAEAPDAPEMTSAPFEDLEELPALLEALLFVADHPLDETYLARALEVSAPRVRSALDALAEALRDGGRGVRLQHGPEGVQLVSAPEAAPHVERFLGLEATRRLSTAALETLAIIAYRQPITRGQIDAIRGVSSDGAIQTLRARGLVESAGHAAGPGRPMLLRTSQRFLEHFGLERPGQLPPLPEDVELPAAEISEQLGLDEALVEQVLSEAEVPAAPEFDAADAVATDVASEADGIANARDGEIELPHDVQALTEAAGQAFTSHAATAEPDAGGEADAEADAANDPGGSDGSDDDARPMAG